MDNVDKVDKYAEEWSDAYRRLEAEDLSLTYPSETLVRLLKGNYIDGVRETLRGKKVLDIGFGTGNNTRFLASLGMDVCGVEIDPYMCENLLDFFNRRHLEGVFLVGTNQSIPFPDESFDYLISWNVIHYEGEQQNVEEALKEYARVLKPDGRLLLSTTGPLHKILDKSIQLNKNTREIRREDDFRCGQKTFIFNNKDEISCSFTVDFREVQVGRTEDFLFTEKLDWWIVTAIR